MRHQSNRLTPRLFTLIELLVVIAIIAILASMLLPALAAAKDKGNQATCIGNIRQCHTALILYVDDNDQRLPFPTEGWTVVPGVSCDISDPWVFWPTQLAQYAGGSYDPAIPRTVTVPDVFECPANPLSKLTMGYWGVTYTKWITLGFRACVWRQGYPLAKVKNPVAKWGFQDIDHPALGDDRSLLTSTACGQWTCGANVKTTHAWMVPHRMGVNTAFMDGHAIWKNANQAFAEITSAAAPMSPYSP